jgi:hypothetical protein
MSKWNRNGDGYTDSTACMAISKLSKEERKNAMAKKRSCRRTTDENVIHDKAVKLRKMTDEQLVHYVEDRVEKARSEGFNRGREQNKPVNIMELINAIGNIRGIGESKLADIKAILEKHLEVGDGG